MKTKMTSHIQKYLQQLSFPEPNSHKGQNGKLMIIGGSELFHAASKWSLDVASKVVDMVFYSSVPSNNLLIREAKENFWNGIVVERENLEAYIDEADCILIGPGMDRSQETKQLTTNLLHQYQHKKWVIDAGALQMMDPKLLNQNCIITPHHQEMSNFLAKISPQLHSKNTVKNFALTQLLQSGVTIILKGPEDTVFGNDEQIKIEGGNAGMTKGGTGDVLAGFVAALYCTQEKMVSAVTASYICKRAGDQLFNQTGYYFNASDLVQVIPQVFWTELKTLSNSSSL